MSDNQRPYWNEHYIEFVRNAWRDGMSAGEIAKALAGQGAPFTRNAVIGKLHRLGITRARKAPAIRARRWKPKRLAGEPPELPIDPETGLRGTLIKPAESADPQEPRGCRYIYAAIGEAGFRYCQKPQAAVRRRTIGIGSKVTVATVRSAYCPEHHLCCYARATSRRIPGGPAEAPPARQAAA